MGVSRRTSKAAEKRRWGRVVEISEMMNDVGDGCRSRTSRSTAPGEEGSTPARCSALVLSEPCDERVVTFGVATQATDPEYLIV
jgi:hypothetical protein